MIDPAILSALRAAGATADLILAAVEADAALEAGKSVARREAAAERQRASRARHVMSRAVTASDCDKTSPHVTRTRAKPVALPFSIEDALAVWNETAEKFGLPKALSATGKRQAMLRQRLLEQGEDGFRKAVEAVGRSKFCQGENERGWRADLGFLLRPDNFVKLIEGGYDKAGEVPRIKPPMTAEELRRGIARAEDFNDPERAAELKRQLAALKPVSDDPKVASIIAGAARSMQPAGRVGHG